MMDLRSVSRVLMTTAVPGDKGGHEGSHLLLARSQKTKVWATDRPSDFRRFARRECHDIVSHVMEFFRRFDLFFVGLKLLYACFPEIYNIAWRIHQI
ncbi:hypothetical protein TNCV_2574801 [Trichonephila clavipes]|nr:hypothetical protein TNCV_2574801 [Trichonephila clavipes]